MSPRLLVSPSPCPPLSSARGWTLIELVITITVMTVLTLGVIPLVKTSIRRQKEQRLREVLREMREAVDMFKRDTAGMQCALAATAGNPQQQQQTYVDPRSRVVIADCKIFTVDNVDRYPPDLQTLVEGVDVVPRVNPAAMGGAGLGNSNVQATDVAGGLVPKRKRYLREIPVDPITGEREWCIRSSVDEADEDCSSSPANVFDVRSKSEGTALNGEKYSDW